MYCLENVKQFVFNDSKGSALSPIAKRGILDRAKTRIDQRGFISGGNTKYIMGDKKTAKIFEDALGSDMNQLQILGKLAKSMTRA